MPRSSWAVLPLAALLLAAPAARADDGALESSLTPRLNTTPAPSAAGFHRLVVQPDGRMVAAGFANFTGDTRIAVERFTATGAPDATFGGGLVLTDIPGSIRDVAEDPMLLPDGRVELAGTAFAPDGRSDIALVRYNADGTPDGTLDGTGFLVDRAYQDQGGGLIRNAKGLAAALYTAPDTRIAVAGSVLDTSTTPTDLLAIFRQNGSGFAHQAFFAEPTSESEDVIVDPGGKLVLGGYATRPGGLDVFQIARYFPNGDLDSPQFASPAFGPGTFRPSEAAFAGASGARAQALARQPDGRYVLAGFANFGGTKRIALARFNPGGGLDPTFGTGGMVTTALGASSATDVLVQPDGKIVVAGAANLGSGSSVALLRYLPSGRLDTSFGGDGIVLTVLPGSSVDAGDGVTRLADGRLVVVGTDRSSTGEPRFLVLRYGQGICSLLLGCPIVKVISPSTVAVVPDLTKAIGVGILVRRIVRTRRVHGKTVYVTRRVGRVPFGTLKPGTRPVNWHLKVGGHRLKPGRYLINVRALRHGKVVAVARGQVIRVRRGA